MKWQTGQSGNPGGRKPGTGKTEKWRAALAKELPEVLEALVAQAKAGDTGAIKLILERTVPALRPVDAAVKIPGKRGKDSMQDRIEGITDLMLSGELPASVAASLLDVLTARAKMVELADLQQQVAELKAAQPQQPKR